MAAGDDDDPRSFSPLPSVVAEEAAGTDFFVSSSRTIPGGTPTSNHSPQAHLTLTTPLSVLPMLPSHCLPTWAVLVPHLRSPCSSITKTPSPSGAVPSSSNKSPRRRSLTRWASHPDSDRNHCRLCASFRCAPATGSVLARAVRVLLRSAGGRGASKGPGAGLTGSPLVIAAPPRRHWNTARFLLQQSTDDTA